MRKDEDLEIYYSDDTMMNFFDEFYFVNNRPLFIFVMSVLAMSAGLKTTFSEIDNKFFICEFIVQ